jgi:hypothetical protein
MGSLRTHLSYANVVATLALVFAMSGGAFAAHHFLITSTKQISPKVLRKLRGNRGPKGADGAPGHEGAKGVAGQFALLPLPSGQSESGEYAMHPANTGTGEYVEAMTFPIRLAAVIPAENAVWTATTTAHCSGPGHADPGYLCVYSQGVSGAESPEIRNYEGASLEEGTGHFGFYLEWPITGPEASDIGTYTVTAP